MSPPTRELRLLLAAMSTVRDHLDAGITSAQRAADAGRVEEGLRIALDAGRAAMDVFRDLSDAMRQMAGTPPPGRPKRRRGRGR